MSVVGIGVDITIISRIEKTLQRYQDRFLKRVFHPIEVEHSLKRSKNAEYLAGCFAVKEAALKAMGDFPGRGIDWADIYITHKPSGQPQLHLEGKARVLADEKGVVNAHVSITHDGDYALAQVLLER